MELEVRLKKLREKIVKAEGLDRRLLSTKEAARYLGCSIGNIRNLVDTGKLSTVHIGAFGRAKAWYDVKDLDKLVEDSK
jgi:excisionase family DNA binding protein